jgi:hypothetical protein
MLVLLDENLLSRKLKKPIIEAGHSAFNVDNMGWRGTKDRDLLVLADAYPFDVLSLLIRIYPTNRMLVLFYLLQHSDLSVVISMLKD